MLERLYLDNYKRLSSFEIKPDPVAALVGPKGGEKTTVFNILQGLQMLLTSGTDLRLLFPSTSLTRWDKRRDQRIEFDAEEGGSPLYLFPHDPARPGKRGFSDPGGETDVERTAPLQNRGRLCFPLRR